MREGAGPALQLSCPQDWHICALGSSVSPQEWYRACSPYVLQLVRGRASFSSLKTWGQLSHQPKVTRGEVEGKATFPHSCQHTSLREWEKTALLVSYLQDQLTCTPANRVSSTLLPRRGAGLALLSAAASEGWNQLRAALSSRFLVVTGAMDIYIDHGCSRATEPDTALGSSPGPGNTMVQGGSTGHSGLYCPGRGSALEH